MGKECQREKKKLHAFGKNEFGQQVKEFYVRLNFTIVFRSLRLCCYSYRMDFFLSYVKLEGAFVLRDATTSRCPEAWDH